MFWAISLKREIYISDVIFIFDPQMLNLTLRPNELSHRNEIGLRLKLFSRAFISSPILLLLMIGSLRKACSKKSLFFVVDKFIQNYPKAVIQDEGKAY